MKSLLATCCIILIVAMCLVYMSKNGKVEQKPEQETVPAKNLEEPKPIVEESVKIFDNYKEALAESIKTQKPLFLYFTADWCAFCKKMKNETLENEQIKKELLSEYVPCYLDFDSNKDLARKLKIRQIPTYIAISPDGMILSRGQGYKNKDDFANWLKPKNVSFTE